MIFCVLLFCFCSFIIFFFSSSYFVSSPLLLFYLYGCFLQLYPLSQTLRFLFIYFFTFYQAFNSQGFFVYSLRIPVTCHPALVSRMLSQYRIHLPMQETQETLVQSLGQEDSPGGGCGYPLQYSCLGNPMDRGPWQTAVHGVTKSGTRLSTQHIIFKN